MEKKTKLALGAVVALAALGTAAGVGFAGGSESDQQMTGRAYERATAAALEHVGGGRVVEAEVGDDAAGYEVEILRRDGRQVEVQLDESFEVMGSERDHDGPDDVVEGDQDD